ncbi:MAG: SDR family oxidoreductase [Dehalococcoidia bacterium]|nr:SDR family oxidoreductase [Dehalococcoidia bacterium]
MISSLSSQPVVASADRPLLGRTALVTGAGRGLGEATAAVLAAAGATVLVADIRDDLAEAVASRLCGCHGTGAAEPLSLDVTDASSVDRAVRVADETFGGLDILVNNAGTDVTCPVEEISVDDFDRVLATNLRGPFLLARAVFPQMKTRGRGHVVNIVSTAARRAWANASAYHASKWGLLGLSHALHVEGRAAGVSVTAVIAGGMRTPFLLDRFPDIDPSVLQDPANVAATVRFVLLQPPGTVIPEVTVLPLRETSWP